MFRKFALSAIGAASLAVVPLAVATPATGQETDFEHVIDVTLRQSMLTERMAKEVVLIAMGHNTRENIRNLRSSRDTFDRTLTGLRFGDFEMALQPTSDETILARLAEIENVWPLFAVSVEQAIASGQITQTQVSTVADLAGPLEDAVEDTVEAYEEIAQQGNLYTMLQVAMQAAGEQRTASQTLAKDYFLIAYGLEPDRRRMELTQGIKEFDAVLSGLLHGDTDMLLIAAPTPQIEAQLKQVEQLWAELEPVLSAAVRGDQIDEDGVSMVSSMNLSILSELNAVVRLYDSL